MACSNDISIVCDAETKLASESQPPSQYYWIDANNMIASSAVILILSTIQDYHAIVANLTSFFSNELGQAIIQVIILTLSTFTTPITIIIYIELVADPMHKTMTDDRL